AWIRVAGAGRPGWIDACVIRFVARVRAIGSIRAWISRVHAEPAAARVGPVAKETVVAAADLVLARGRAAVAAHRVAVVALLTRLDDAVPAVTLASAAGIVEIAYLRGRQRPVEELDLVDDPVPGAGIADVTGRRVAGPDYPGLQGVVGEGRRQRARPLEHAVHVQPERRPVVGRRDVVEDSSREGIGGVDRDVGAIEDHQSKVTRRVPRQREGIDVVGGVILGHDVAAAGIVVRTRAVGPHPRVYRELL